jgi:hypothetical protein
MCRRARPLRARDGRRNDRWDVLKLVPANQAPAALVPAHKSIAFLDNRSHPARSAEQFLSSGG